MRLLKLDYCFYKKKREQSLCSPSVKWGHWESSHLQAKKQALTMNQVCQHCGLSSFKNFEKEMSVN